MVKHYNPTITEDAMRIFNTKMGDNVANEVNPVIQPVVSIQRDCNIIRRGSAINSLSGTIYTTPTDKDFYLCSANISVQKDATSTNTSSRLSFTKDGVVQSILAIRGLSLTALHADSTISLTIPIKIDRGTSIILSSDTNVANISIEGCISGYTVETTKGV